MTPTSDLILIADGHATRGERLLRAVEAQGHRGRLASHGASALEIALSELPRLIVVQADLPLVDGAKLAEILRANPRTRGVRLLVLCRDARRAAWIGVGDEWIAAASSGEEIARAVEAMIDRQARIERLEEGAHAANALAGELSDIRPVELLQLLHLRRVTGRLTLAGSASSGAAGSPAGASAPARVDFAAGEIVDAAVGPVRGEKALFRLLERADGSFRFDPGPAPAERGIDQPSRLLLAEGLRQLEEWNRIAAKLPTLESPIRLRIARDELPPVLHPLTQEVLGLIEQASRVADVVDRSSQPDYQILRTLHTLAERGIVEFGRVRIAPPEAARGALFGEAQCRRLRGFVQSERRAGGPLPNAKLIVVAASTIASRRFAELLEKVPGSELVPSPERGRGRDGRLPLAPIARLAVDDELSIDLIHFPADPLYAPLRAFAAHRALGTIFLLDASMGTSAFQVAEVAADVGREKGARSFHVVMLGEGERFSPDELRKNLSLLDSASLFLLPMDPHKDPSSLMRSLFARIVP
jgi:CheY-like chemotaxis protein